MPTCPHPNSLVRTSQGNAAHSTSFWSNGILDHHLHVFLLFHPRILSSATSTLTPLFSNHLHSSKMKFSLALVATLFTSAAAVESISQVRADSKFGMDLLSKARRAEENGDEEVDTTWIANYALKFQGCHHISQWNSEADGEDDVRIETKRLARFRLCPIDSCSANSGGGCSSKYGDYIVDMDTFIASYLTNKQEAQEEACETAEANCDCDYYANNGYDSEEACMSACLTNAGYSDCVEVEEDEYYQKPIQAEDYVECTAYAGAGRRLEDNGNDDEDDGGYYIGPYCSNNGGKIVLGMFTDDTCTQFADEYGGRTTFESTFGSSLPYSQESIVNSDCYTCAGEQEQNEYGYYVASTKEACGELYQYAGKCESKLSSEVGESYINENACTYMEGVKITRKNGIIISGLATKNKVASAFIGMFSVSFVLLGSYVYYLKTKLDRGSVNLSD